MRPTPESPKGRERFFVEKNEYWATPLIRGTQIVEPQPDQTQLTRRYTEEAVKFIRTHKSQPFFLYFPHTFPHVPLFASDKFRGKSPAGIYGDVVEELDWSVGQVLDTVRQEGLAERTLVVFSSDNGPWLIFDSHGGTAGQLREGKGSTWEGGMRVPGIFWWPSKVKAGVIQREMALTMDVLPTVCKQVGIDSPQERAIDGRDISPLLFGTGKVEREVFLYYRGQTLYAARLGDWKAHFITRSAYGPDKPEAHDPPSLYNLRVDPSERFDIAAKHSEVIAKIKEAVAQKLAGIKPAESQLIETVK